MRKIERIGWIRFVCVNQLRTSDGFEACKLSNHVILFNFAV